MLNQVILVGRIAKELKAVIATIIIKIAPKVRLSFFFNIKHNIKHTTDTTIGVRVTTFIGTKMESTNKNRNHFFCCGYSFIQK